MMLLTMGVEMSVLLQLAVLALRTAVAPGSAVETTAQPTLGERVVAVGL